MTAREQAGERKPRLALLAEHHLADAGDDGIEGVTRGRGLSFRGEGHWEIRGVVGCMPYFS